MRKSEVRATGDRETVLQGNRETEIRTTEQEVSKITPKLSNRISFVLRQDVGATNNRSQTSEVRRQGYRASEIRSQG